MNGVSICGEAPGPGRVGRRHAFGICINKLGNASGIQLDHVILFTGWQGIIQFTDNPRTIGCKSVNL